MTQESHGLALDGRWAAITGGSKGIGFGIARAFLAEGANLVLVARGQADLAKAQAELAAQARPGQSVLAMTADTSDRTDITRLFARLATEIPSLDIFVANAGSGSVVPLLEITEEYWDSVMDLNLDGTFWCIQKAAQRMATQPRGDHAILAVSSIRALGARPGRLAYAVTKAGLNQLVKSAAQELAPLGIRVNALSPGITETPLASLNPEAFQAAVKTVPMGRAGAIDDMGAGALYLCSTAAHFVTGVNLIVDGGESLG